jgi:hypothetical protein
MERIPSKKLERTRETPDSQSSGKEATDARLIHSALHPRLFVADRCAATKDGNHVIHGNDKELIVRLKVDRNRILGVK